jgi:hypothetical protein
MARLLADMARHPSVSGGELLREAVEADADLEPGQVADVIDLATKRRRR